MAITSNNVQNVKFLRNGSLFTTRTEARTALEGFSGLTYEKDGTAILARYGSNDDVKTLVGWVYADNNNHKSVTIFDIDDAGGDVDEKIAALRTEINNELGTGITSANTATAQLVALSGNSSTDTSTTTSVEGAKKYAKDYTDEQIGNLDYTGVTTGTGVYVTNVTEANGVVAATTATLPTVGAISENGKPITAVAEDKGTISASAGTINAEFVNITDSGSLITATTVEGALAEIAAEIDAMDKDASAVAGQVVTTVSEADGKVSETKANVKDLQLGGYSKSSSTGAIASADTINEALSKLENKAAATTVTPKDKSIVVETTGATTEVGVNIRSGERVLKLDTDATSGGVYTNLNLVEITGDTLPAEIKVRYELRDSDNVKIGESIDIPKDSHIVSISYITGGTHAQNLEYVYIDVSGNTQTTYVDMSALVLEVEFESGVTVDAGSHIVHGVVDPTSEKDESNVSFLTVGADGFKVSGIKDAIDTKINKLDADLSGNTTHVTVGVAEADGKITAVTVAESDIANKTDLDTLSGKTVTAVEMTGGTATTASTTDGTKKITINADGSSIKMTGYDKGSDSGAVASSDSINAAIGKLENQIAGQIDALDADVSGNSTHVTVGVEEVNGKITAVTVSESNIANADDLTNEIAARKAVDGQSGQTYTANSGKAYISGATSLNDADIKLNDALASLDADVIKSVKVNNVALTETSNAVNVQISSVAASETASSPIVVKIGRAHV